MWKNTKFLCSFFTKKEPKKFQTIFHRERPNCGKQTGVFRSLRRGTVGAGYTRPGNGTAATRWPGRRIRRPYGQPIHRQFPPAGSRPRPTAPRKFAVAGVRAHPNQRWRIGKTDGKTVSPGVFPGFFDSTSPLGVLGVCNPQAVPRASEVAATFSVPFWSVKKERIPGARTSRETARAAYTPPLQPTHP